MFYWKMSESLISSERWERLAQVAHQKWAMWAKSSGRSPKMSNHERFAHFTQRKWAIVSESLSSLTKNECMNELLIVFKQIAHSLIFGQKKSYSLGKPMSKFPALAATVSKGLNCQIVKCFYHPNCYLNRGEMFTVSPVVTLMGITWIPEAHKGEVLSAVWALQRITAHFFTSVGTFRWSVQCSFFTYIMGTDFCNLGAWWTVNSNLWWTFFG